MSKMAWDQMSMGSIVLQSVVCDGTPLIKGANLFMLLNNQRRSIKNNIPVLINCTYRNEIGKTHFMQTKLKGLPVQNAFENSEYKEVIEL